MFLQVAGILAPAFLCIGAGYAWARFGKRALDTRQIAQLVTDISSPCLILATIPGLSLDHSRLLDFAGLSLLAIFITAGIATLLLTLSKLPIRDFLPPLLFGNHGNLGLSLCLFAFGNEGLAYALIFFTLTTLLHFTLGIGLLDRQMQPLRILVSPLTLAMLASLGLMATGQVLPGWAHQTLALLGNTAIPLMLLALGVSLSSLTLSGSVTGLQLTLYRSLAGLGGALAVSTSFTIPRLAEQILLLQSAMPAAVFSYLLAVRYDRSPTTIASFVVYSTLAAIPLLFAVLWWLTDQA